MKTTILSACMLLAAVARADDDDNDGAPHSDADAIKAARLIFGEGLKIESNESSRTVKIAFDPQGGLDEAKVRKLIDAYIAPMVELRASNYRFSADYQVILTDYTRARDKGGNAFVMMEPQLKRQLCVDIAGQVEDDARKTELEDWCWLAAARFARHSQHDFSGVPVESPVTGVYSGKLAFADKLFSAGRWVLIVPGSPGPSNVQSMRVMQNLLKYIPPENRYHREALELLQANEAWIKTRVAEVAALDKKIGGPGKVVWGTRFFGPWDPVEPVASLADCRAAYWKAYGPSSFARDAVFVWEMAVNGSSCKNGFIQNQAVAAGGPFWTSDPAGCAAQLVAPGKHTLKVALYATKDEATGRKNVDVAGDRLVVSDEIRAARTRTVAQGTMSCTSP